VGILNLTFSVSCKKNQGKHQIFLNGELWRTVSPRLFGRNPQFDVQNLEEFEEHEYRSALIFAVRSLSAKAQHSCELRKKILDLGASQKTTDRVIEELLRLGYLNDQEWFDCFIRSQILKKVGKSGIRQKFMMKGIPRQECEEALEFYMTDDVQEKQIQLLMETRYQQKDLDDPKQRQQVISGLARRGFSWDLIVKVLK